MVLINRALPGQGNCLTNHYNTNLKKFGSLLSLIPLPLPVLLALSTFSEEQSLVKVLTDSQVF